MSYRVTSPLVVVKDQTGRLRHTYHGAIVPWLNDEQREHFLRHKLVEEIGAPDAKVAAASGAPSRPAKVAPKDDWVEWGVHNGHDRAELEALTKPELADLLG